MITDAKPRAESTDVKPRAESSLLGFAETRRRKTKSSLLGYAMARTDGTARGEAEFTQTIQSRDGRRQKSKRTIKNVMSMSMAGRISEEKSSFLSTYTSLIAVLYGVRPLYTVYLLRKTLQRYNIFPVFE